MTLPVDPARVRRQLLGREGPYADPRIALDALDDVEAAIASLDPTARRAFSDALFDLVLDDDPTVAAGAALSLELVRDVLDVARAAELVRDDHAGLDRPADGFSRSSGQSVRDELAIVAARAATSRDATQLRAMIDVLPATPARPTVVAELATRLPSLVVAEAWRWVGPDDAVVLARLRRHADRVAVAGAVRPWSSRAIEAVGAAAAWQRWDAREVGPLLGVMRDEAPELTRPQRSGLDTAGERWWIVAERPWTWTLWRSAGGRHALERVEGGVGMWTSVVEISPGEAGAVLAQAIEATEPA